MAEAIVCPACGARMRHHRKRCLRCGTDLPARRPAVVPAYRRWLRVHWRLLAACGLAALWLVIAIVSLSRRPAPDLASQPPAVRPPAPQRQAAGDQSASTGLAPVPLADPDLIGRVSYREGDYPAALERYRDAIARNPNDAESLSNCGQALVRLGRPAEAVSYFERAIALNGRRWAYHFNLAHASGLLEQWDRAVDEYRVAADLFPDDHVTEYNLGMALHKRGDEATAVEHFRRAIELAPDEADFQLSMGISSERLGRTPDAIDAYRRYLEMAPSSAQAGKVRARLESLKTAPAPKPAAPPPTPKSEAS